MGAGLVAAWACGAGLPAVGRGVAGSADPVQQLALGAYHTCALVESGRVACWGDNQLGQLAQNTVEASATPSWVADLDDVVELRASDSATCARRRDAAVVCWGGNAHGEAAPRDALAPVRAAGAYDRSGEPAGYAPGNVRRTPGEIGELQGARALAMGARHGCALLDDGRVTCWGDASLGQLGPGAAGAFQLRAVTGLPAMVEIAAAGASTCGRTATGEVWCWGGEAGVTPAPVAGIAGATRVQVLGGRACAWNSSGEVSCWGDSGACADTAEPSAAAAVAEYRDTLSLARAAGGCFWCLLRSSHELSCDNPPPERGHLSIAGARSVVAGNDHACAIRDDGSVWCWGSNVRGELGRATAADRDPAPAPVQWHGP